MYSSGGDGMLVQWDMREEDGVLLARETEAIYALYDMKDKLLAGSAGGMLSVLNKEDRSVLKRMSCSKKSIFDIALVNNMVLAACGDGRLLVFDTAFALQGEYKISGHSLRKILPVDKGRIAVAGTESHIWILDDKYRVTETIEDHESSVFALAFRTRDQRLLSGGRDARIRVHHHNVLEQTIQAHLLHIHALSFSPSQKYLLSSSMDKTIKLWDGQTLELLKVIDRKYEGHTSSVNSVVWLGDDIFASCSDDRRVILWQLLEN